jgi:hypothetical protein
VATFLVAAALVIGVMMNIDTLVSMLSDTNLSPSAPTPTAPTPTAPTPTAPTPTAAACPEAAAAWLPNGGSGAVLVAAYTSKRHVITVCRDQSGQHYYDGRVKDAAVTSETHIFLPAERTATGFMARNGSYVYQITGAEIIVSNNGTVLSRSPLTRTAP